MYCRLRHSRTNHPPSIVLIILAEMMNLEVGNVFAAAILPGLGLVLLYISYLLIISYFHKTKTSETSLAFLPILKSLALPLSLVFVVLGSILGGLASPTEAAACRVAGALLMSLPQKNSVENPIELSIQTTKTSAMVFWLLIGAQFFGVVFRGLGGDFLIDDLIEQSQVSASWIVFGVMLLLFILGFFLDFLEICFILIPIILPIMEQLGVNTLWLSIMIAINLQTSFLTPPFGFALFI